MRQPVFTFDEGNFIQKDAQYFTNKPDLGANEKIKTIPNDANIKISPNNMISKNVFLYY